MANVFLSYDHEDVGKAKLIAATLQKAGHSVWWDQHINSGTQYSKAIEQALESADAVVVLWSARSVESPWVRDEAATGRDRARLIPVTLDGTGPPLGFRQFQTSDLSQWKGRRPTAQLRSLVSDIERIAGQRNPAPAASGTIAAIDSHKQPRRRVTMLTAGGLALLAIAVALFWWLRSPISNAPTVSIIPADTSSPSRQLAATVRVALGDLQHSGAMNMRLLDADNSAKSDLLIKVQATGDSDRPAAEVMLTSRADQTIIWSKQFNGSASDHSSFKDVLAASIGRVLGCATEEAKGLGLSIESRRNFLDVCTLTDESGYRNTCSPPSENYQGHAELRASLGSIVERRGDCNPAFRTLVRCNGESNSNSNRYRSGTKGVSKTTRAAVGRTGAST